MSKLSIDDLVADLQPVRPVRTGMLAIGLMLALAVGLAIIYLSQGTRPDLATVMFTPVFALKLAMVLAVAVASAGALAVLARPEGRLQRRARAMLGGAATLFVLPGLASLFVDPDAAIMQFGIAKGVHCSVSVIAASIPAMLVVTWWLRRGAPTQPAIAGLLGGVTAGAIGGLAFLISCPFDHPMFVLLWYGVVMMGGGVAWGLAARRFTSGW